MDKTTLMIAATAVLVASHPLTSFAQPGNVGQPPAAPAPQAPGTAPSSTPAAVPGIESKINNAGLKDGAPSKDGVSPAILRAEVLLDRANDSPGVIDGKAGANFSHALESFEAQRDLPDSGDLDAQNWEALLKVGGPPVLMDYVLTDDDVAGPFYPNLPEDYSKQAALPTLGYRNVLQKIGAKFHMGERLLSTLNPGSDLSKAETKIVVAQIAAQPVQDKVEHIIVDKSKSQVRGYDGARKLIFSAPATIGSRELPSPSGTYKVKGVSWNPIYYYNPKNFVQGHNKEKLRLPPGPNNPVGSVYIALTKPTYGLHGTPDPSSINKTASHGCVRMTNWDAVDLAHLVRFGDVVHFTDKAAKHHRSAAKHHRLRRL